MTQFWRETPPWFRNVLLIGMSTVIVLLAGGILRNESDYRHEAKLALSDHDKRIQTLERRSESMEIMLKVIMDATARIEGDMKEHIRLSR